MDLKDLIQALVHELATHGNGEVDVLAGDENPCAELTVRTVGGKTTITYE